MKDDLETKLRELRQELADEHAQDLDSSGEYLVMRPGEVLIALRRAAALGAESESKEALNLYTNAIWERNEALTEVETLKDRVQELETLPIPDRVVMERDIALETIEQLKAEK